MIGCDCGVCRSSDPRDHRTRPSVLVSYPHEGGPASAARPGAEGGPPVRRILIDTAPELRLQMVRHQVDRLDAILFTHAHADHIFGLDDVRRFNLTMKAPVDIYAEPPTLGVLKEIFRYIFEPHTNVNQSFIASLVAHQIEPESPLDLFGVTWTPLRLLHGRLPILGFRLDAGGRSLAYCTDVSSIPPETYPLLGDLDVLVLDALRYRHHPTHQTVERALEQIQHIRPRRAYLTHIAHDIRHADLEARLPEHVYLAFDGLTVVEESGT